MGVFWGSLVEIHRNRVAPVEAFLWFHKDKRWAGLAMEDKGTPHALGGSSRDPEEVEGREKSKLTKMAGSGSLAPWPLTLAPCFVNNDCVAAEITYSAAHVRHEVYVTAEITYKTAHVHHKILTWTWVTLCGMPV